MARITQHPILNLPKNKKIVSFTFNNQELNGIEGEPVASALAANGISILAIHSKDDTPQGLFCANGQCSHCTLIINGLPQKSCITPLKEGMQIKTLFHLPSVPEDRRPLQNPTCPEHQCDVLIIGGGPSGITAAIELAKLGFNIILVDDKPQLGGKLLLQTHKFFGSIEDCYAGTRGIEIAQLLEEQIKQYQNITVFTNTTVVGIYKDQKAGLFIANKSYHLVAFEGLVVSSGAREKTLIFPGNHLPGVIGAGAFQTLVNRDLIRSSERIFIVGTGNVGLIAAYHALQAGIQVVGICDILSEVSGYQVHADKIKRLGVPIYLSHTVISAEGKERVTGATIAAVNEHYQPLLETAKSFKIDTLLIAVGLVSIDEFYATAQQFGFKVVKTGDADEIAEASSAMFGGRIAGLKMAQLLGHSVTIDASYAAKAEILKSKPGKTYPRNAVTLDENFRPIIRCTQEIPCNPCTAVCPKNSIQLQPVQQNILDIPVFAGDCSGCMQCVLICPGLAITLARRIDQSSAEVVVPFELLPSFKVGDRVTVTNWDGEPLEEAEVLKIRFVKKFKTYLISLKTSLQNGSQVAGIRVQPQAVGEPLPSPILEHIPGNGIVCHCELVTVQEVVDFIKQHKVRDVNQLKLIRVGMGACGGKTCSSLLPRIFQEAGVPWSEVKPGTRRPLFVEVPMAAIVNEESEA